MIARALDSNGDIVTSGKQFITDSEAVAQLIKTNLKLFIGEYFRDITIGLPFFEKIAVKNFSSSGEAEKENIIKSIIFNTTGVKKIITFKSNFDLQKRSLNIDVDVETIFDQIIKFNEAINYGG